MSVEIRVFEASMIGDVVAVFNRLTQRTPYCCPITPEIFMEGVTARKEFDPAGLFVAYNRKAVGLIHARIWERNSRKGGSICLFLCEDREACVRLVRAAVDYLKGQGAEWCEVMGNAPGAQLFYAGMYMGYEVILWRGYYAAINALQRAGFECTCEGFIMSLDMDEEPVPGSPATDVSFRVRRDEDAGSFYTRGEVEAFIGAEKVGRCGFHRLKWISSHLGRGIGQITIGVDPRHHRQGIGAALLSRAHAELYRAGVRTVILATNYALYPAIRLYEKLGYRKELIDLKMFWKPLAEE